MARIVIEVSDQNKQLVDALEQLVEVLVRIEERSAGGKAIDYAHIEREVGAATALIEREAHRGILASLDIDAAKIRISGGLFSRVGRYEATYYTMAGPVTVDRSLCVGMASATAGWSTRSAFVLAWSPTAGCHKPRVRWLITFSAALHAKPRPVRSRPGGSSTRAAA